MRYAEYKDGALKAHHKLPGPGRVPIEDDHPDLLAVIRKDMTKVADRASVDPVLDSIIDELALLAGVSKPEMTAKLQGKVSG